VPFVAWDAIRRHVFVYFITLYLIWFFCESDLLKSVIRLKLKLLIHFCIICNWATFIVLLFCLSNSLANIEFYINSVWLSNKSAKQYMLSSTRWYAAAFALRQRMLNFVQNFQYYMMFEVIEPYWQLFEANLNLVSSLIALIL